MPRGQPLDWLWSIAIWSCFSLLHAFVTRGMGWIGFAVARFGLGFGESGNFPACIKTVAEWFPKKERALATGIPEERCRRINLGFLDPASVKIGEWAGREAEDILVVPRAGEMLYRLAG